MRAAQGKNGISLNSKMSRKSPVEVDVQCSPMAKEGDLILNLEQTPMTNQEFVLNDSSVQSKENNLNFSTDRDFLDL